MTLCLALLCLLCSRPHSLPPPSVASLHFLSPPHPLITPPPSTTPDAASHSPPVPELHLPELTLMPPVPCPAPRSLRSGTLGLSLAHLFGAIEIAGMPASTAASFAVRDSNTSMVPVGPWGVPPSGHGWPPGLPLGAPASKRPSLGSMVSCCPAGHVGWDLAVRLGGCRRLGRVKPVGRLTYSSLPACMWLITNTTLTRGSPLCPAQ